MTARRGLKDVSKMAALSGRTIVAQEGRFLLEDNSRGHRLFITSPSLGLTPEELR
jgi:hypothetical protein